MNNIKVYIKLFLLWGLCFSEILSDQPSYQVGIFIRFHPRGPPIHLCNGAIIQSRLVVTSASCTYYQFTAGAGQQRISASSLTIVAGREEEFISSVESIEIASNFNITTKENDVAILKLSQSLPLATRDDMQWIILNDNDYKDIPCMATFNVRNVSYSKLRLLVE